MNPESSQFFAADNYFYNLNLLPELESKGEDDALSVSHRASEGECILSRQPKIVPSDKVMQQMYKDLHEKNQELQEKFADVLNQMDELRLSLSFILPHELRTPLNVILGFSRLLMFRSPDQLSSSDEILKMYTAIYENALRMEHLVENYLLYAQLLLKKHAPESNSGETRQSDKPIFTESLITSIAQSKVEKVQRKGDLRLDMVEAKIQISTRSLGKIVEELIDNALKFSKSGTPVHVITCITGQQWILKIMDQGRGMTAEQISKIGAFMQFDRKRHEQQGSGLGLTITCLLAQLNNGELTIESAPNQGTTVTLKVPRVQ